MAASFVVSFNFAGTNFRSEAADDIFAQALFCAFVLISLDICYRVKVRWGLISHILSSAKYTKIQPARNLIIPQYSKAPIDFLKQK